MDTLSSLISMLNELVKINKVLVNSFECYTASTKPVDTWDEYDIFILPAWIDLEKALSKAERILKELDDPGSFNRLV